MTALDLSKVAPWSSDTPDLLPNVLGHVCQVTATLPDGTDVTLDPEGGTLSFDENRVPRVEARITCRLPDVAVQASLDPRTNVRLALAAGYVRPNGAQDVQDMVDLDLRDRRINRPRDVMDLTARSDEVLVLDDSPQAGATITGSTVVNAITSAILSSVPTATVDASAVPGPNVGPATTVYPVTDKWSTIADLGDRIGCQVYDAGKRSWVIEPAMGAIAAPVAYLAAGAGGTMTDLDDTLTRDGDWYNRVQLTYEWRDGGGLDRRVIATRSVNSGPYAAVPGSVKTLDLSRGVPTTNPAAIAAADAILSRSVTRGRLTRIVAPSAYWLRPGHTVEVTFPSGDIELHLVSAVEFDFGTGLMTVDTRLPDNAAGTGSAGGILVADDFERFDGPLGIPNIGPSAWTAPSFLITGGRIEQTQTNSTIAIASVDTGVANHDVEAVLQWVGNTGVALVARAVGTTYIMLIFDTSGTVCRLYKVVSGVATQLVTTSAFTTTSGVSFTSRLTAQGPLISAYHNGTLLFTHDLTGDANLAALSVGTLVGVRNARNAAGTHHYMESITVKEPT